MSAHGYDKKRFSLTAAQGRVLYHLERIFRSTGAGVREYGAYLAAIRAAGLNPEDVPRWSTADCARALRIMEEAAAPMARFRDVRTGWRDFFAHGEMVEHPHPWHYPRDVLEPAPTLALT